MHKTNWAANEYTDNRVNTLEKELSAGIASAAAMSSVAVSGVSKGEVSVGGGYGYYNSQSAVALGAAMGLTDNWSINAAAALSDSNVNLNCSKTELTLIIKSCLLPAFIGRKFLSLLC